MTKNKQNHHISKNTLIIKKIYNKNNDGLTNEEEINNGSEAHNPDTDGDGVEDGQEENFDGTNSKLQHIHHACIHCVHTHTHTR